MEVELREGTAMRRGGGRGSVGPAEQVWVSSWPPGISPPPPTTFSIILPTTHLTIERTLFHDALEGLICPFAFLLNPVTIIWESNREK